MPKERRCQRVASKPIAKDQGDQSKMSVLFVSLSQTACVYSGFGQWRSLSRYVAGDRLSDPTEKIIIFGPQNPAGEFYEVQKCRQTDCLH